MKRWSIIFKALGNINRLKILVLLSHEGRLSVGDIASHLHISIKSTSKNLVLLHQLDILESIGRDGRVYYEINPHTSKDIVGALKLFI